MSFLKPKFWDEKKISFLAILLLPVSLLIKLLSFLKRLTTKSQSFSIPTICVGNIYLGGTGKTPLCIEIFLLLKELNLKPVFIRKEYESYIDEVNLLKSIGPVYQNKKRAKAIENAIQNRANIAILDDGYQDFSINNNLSIICFDEKKWIGNGLVIPAGPLRENISGLKRANCVVINGDKNIQIEKKLFSIKKDIKIFYTEYITQNINEFKNKKIIVFSGIGNPENFLNLLIKNDISVLKEFKFPDHHNYSENEMENLLKESKNNNALLVTTEKDYYRLKDKYKKYIKYLKIKVKINNLNQFVEEIKKII